MSQARRVQEFERRFREAAAAGNPPDALWRFTSDEVERFWSRVIPGLDGHCYWNGGHVFRRNDDRYRKPARWVWEQAYGPLESTVAVRSFCGEPNCVTPEHLEIVPRHTVNLREAIGRVQVVALQLGHPPAATWWKRRKMLPNVGTIQSRFGGWAEFLRAAGLDPAAVPRPEAKYSERTLIEGLRLLARRLGRAPAGLDWNRNRDWLRELGYPSELKTVKRGLGGTWAEALRRAGL